VNSAEKEKQLKFEAMQLFENKTQDDIEKAKEEELLFSDKRQ
jgi:hypothetical protein